MELIVIKQHPGVFRDDSIVTNDILINLDNILQISYSNFIALQLEASGKLTTYSDDPSKRARGKKVNVYQINIDKFEINFLEEGMTEYNRIKNILSQKIVE